MIKLVLGLHVDRLQDFLILVFTKLILKIEQSVYNLRKITKKQRDLSCGTYIAMFGYRLEWRRHSI
jgi:hypothetical protein